MRFSAVLFFFAMIGSMAQAHIGHLGELAGHGHWAAAGALGIAIVVGGLALKGKKKEEAEAADADEEPDGELVGQEA